MNQLIQDVTIAPFSNRFSDTKNASEGHAATHNPGSTDDEHELEKKVGSRKKSKPSNIKREPEGYS
jgi:hypothetical protein